MKSLSIGGAFVLTLVAAPAISSTATLPPMNSFDEAFYNCDSGAAFAIAYDSSQPMNAVMTTSNDNNRHPLKKTPVASGVEFAGDKVKFWTDGKLVVVDGTVTPFRNCKLKAS